MHAGSYRLTSVAHCHFALERQRHTGLKRNLAQTGSCREHRFAWPEAHRTLIGVDPHDVASLPERHTEVPALPHREPVHARVCTYRLPMFVDDGPRSQTFPSPLCHEGIVTPGRHEAKLLALTFFGTRQRELARL